MSERLVRIVARAGVSTNLKPMPLGQRLKLEAIKREDQTKWEPRQLSRRG